MSKKCKVTILILILGGLVLPSLPKNGPAQEVVPVGLVVPLSGPQKDLGRMALNSFQLAAETIAQKGDAQGRKIQLVVKDDASDPKRAGSVFRDLVQQDRVKVVGGGLSSAVAAELAEAAQGLKVPLVISTASADHITEQGFSFVFRLSPPASDYPVGFEGFLARKAGVRQAVVLFEQGPVGQEAAQIFSKRIQALGVETALTLGFTPRAREFRHLFEQIKAVQPDLIYLVADHLDAAEIMRQALKAGLRPRVFGGDPVGVGGPEFIKAAGRAGEYVVTSSLWSAQLPYPGTEEYAAGYVKKFGKEPDYRGAEAHACLEVIAAALDLATSLSPGDVRQALAQTDLMTVFGPVQFRSLGRMTQQNRPPTYAAQWQNQQLVPVWPEAAAAAREVCPYPFLK